MNRKEITEEMAFKLIELFEKPEFKEFIPNHESQFVKVGSGQMENN